MPGIAQLAQAQIHPLHQTDRGKLYLFFFFSQVVAHYQAHPQNLLAGLSFFSSAALLNTKPTNVLKVLA